MKVYNFKTRDAGGRKRVSAEVVWETADRPTEEIFYEVDQEFADDISCNPDAFFISTLIPAMYYGERRYTIESEVCPALLQGAKDALRCLKLWYYKDPKIEMELEVPVRTGIEEKVSRNSACFFTGGIDSYATFSITGIPTRKNIPVILKTALLPTGWIRTIRKSLNTYCHF
ncbi:MAG: hypothetical protein U5K69_18760 [Balneolaceae bacterium]|nr:hypothetical protein [Balneolaceae bacterium]